MSPVCFSGAVRLDVVMRHHNRIQASQPWLVYDTMGGWLSMGLADTLGGCKTCVDVREGLDILGEE